MNSPDIGEQAISKAAEIGLESQLDKSEDVKVYLRANPLDLMQGKVQSVSVKGKGLVMKKELRAEKIHIETGDIDINPIKAALGDIELNSSSDARVLVVLKEEDIQRAFNSKYVIEKLKNLEIIYKGKPVKIEVNRVTFQLPEVGKINLKADIKLIEQNQQEQINFSAIPEVNSHGNSVKLNSIEYKNESEYNTEVAKAIIDNAEEILDLRNFELEQMSMRIRRLDVKPGKLTMEADAVIEGFPDTKV